MLGLPLETVKDFWLLAGFRPSPDLIAIGNGSDFGLVEKLEQSFSGEL